MSEVQNDQLDKRLVQLREAIRTKRNNVADLEVILQQDIDAAKKFPLYFWILFLAHFLVMLEGWRHQRGFQFLFNLVMVMWFQRKVYREIPLHFAMPIGLVVILITVLS